ncbi:MAG: universal stress protein [Cardiobacteriaceae bacterium]|nr:universal stress protein [Cardiobacteriaceae bacterium]
MFKRILLPVDLEHPASAQKVVQSALEVGGEAAEYLVMTVIPPIGGGIVASYLPKNYDKRLKEEMEARLKDFVAEHFAGVAERFQYLVAHGPVYEEINMAAKKHHADLVVVSAAKPGSYGLGPNAARVARYGENNVLIIR